MAGTQVYRGYPAHHHMGHMGGYNHPHYGNSYEVPGYGSEETYQHSHDQHTHDPYSNVSWMSQAKEQSQLPPAAVQPVAAQSRTMSYRKGASSSSYPPRYDPRGMKHHRQQPSHNSHGSSVSGPSQLSLQKWQAQDVYNIPSLEQVASEIHVFDKGMQTAAWKEFVVKVSHRRRDDVLYWYKENLQKDDTVIVSSDRGFDIGIVTDCVPASQTTDHPKESPKQRHSIVFRIATEQETESWRSLQTNQEVQAVEKAKQIISTINIPELNDISFVDAVFQYDGRKLTLYYQTGSQEYKNYRPLLKPLFDIFQCRIWLQKVGKSDNMSSTASTVCDSETSSRKQEEVDEWKEKRKLIMKFPIPDRKEDYPVGPPNSPIGGVEPEESPMSPLENVDEDRFELPRSQSV
eukprot:TRINITY_DN37685_c0_g1_i1.p1 TRINITY_DN37685_c0_g1~~TRINITY_DN37685_c0_g1_i1.p1  ORF type:complete len:428 (+),score=104.39 TRINITY_DN37685_c0_g1_i1:73-1284(+)